MIVCITGMHRSGTSMVARLLNICGLYLGEETELIGAAKDNTAGFWENVNFVNLNDEIMLRFNGGWDTPPKFKQGWETSRKILPVKHQAEELLKKFSDQKYWGWKDPRSSITLPFWQQLIPKLKVIICLRNPLDVAHSLARRGYASETFSFNLWQTYNQRLLNSVHPKNRIITHYDSYFYDPKAELHRLLKFIGIPITEELLKTACLIASTSMRHSQSTVDALVLAKAPKELIGLYLDMCSQAGGTYWGEIQQDLNHTASFNRQGDPPESSTAGLLVRLAEKEKLLQTQQTLIQENQAIIQEQKVSLQKKDSELQKKDSELQKKDSELQQKDIGLKRINTLLSRAENELQTLKSGMMYLAVSKYRRNIERFLPQGTLRRRIYELLLRSIAILFAEGPRGVYSRIRNRWGSSASTHSKYFGLRLPIKKKDPSMGMNIRTTEYSQAYSEMLTVAAGQAKSDYVPISEMAFDENAIVKLIAFYLPQFHPISENDAWWGRGFTEWTNVSKAMPQFVGHYQPHLPGELGFYDLRVSDVQRRQVELAKHYGIYGFCFYYYWFNGKRLLERPVDQFINDSEINFPFCLCWANENWTRRWDGLENEILIAQEHSLKNDLAFIQDIAPILRHKNYIRINNRPLLIVYRTQLMPDPVSTAERWRKYCIDAGIGDPYLVAAQVFEFIDPRSIGFDAAVEFPPNTPIHRTEINREVTILNPNYKGRVYRYADMAIKMINRPRPLYHLFKTVFPGWDNEARRPGQGSSFAFSSPDSYRYWLANACRIASEDPDSDKRIVFINAWNEWAEGAHLEPDRKYGYAYLQATADALLLSQEKELGSSGDWTILFVSHDAHRGGAQSVLLNILTWLKEHTSIHMKVLALDGGILLSQFKELADTLVLRELLTEQSGKNEDIMAGKILDFCGGNPDLIYGNTVAAAQSYELLSRLGAPILTHFHELQNSIERYGREWISDAIKYSAHYIACSSAVQENLIQNHGVNPNAVSTIYSSISVKPSTQLSGLNKTEKIQARRKLGLQHNKHLIFGCGLGMPFRKGADLFIDVAQSLQQKGLNDFHFYWIGDFAKDEINSNGRVWEDYLISLRQNGLKDYVTFAGIKQNPREYLQTGDIFILPSREDPFPLVALEAAECGLPIVCFQGAGGMPDFVKDDAGYIVPFEDVEQMAERIAILIQDENRRQVLGSRARAKLLESFTVDQTAPQIFSVCREVAGKKPAISIIVPNYNHAQYLHQRLESIFNQTYRDFEVILLDDASSDNSLEVLEKYAQRNDVKIIKNDHNSGSTFKQWLKGMDLAQADILWIAESDDLCEPNFLQKLRPAFNDPRVKLAYANSYTINEDGRTTGDYENTEYLTSLSATKWKTGYVVSATQEINDGLGIKNTILSASSALFKKVDLHPETRRNLESMRIAGDWYFFVQTIKGGKIYYEPQKLNHHRRHSGSVIGKLISENKTEDFFREFSLVQRFVLENYKVDRVFQDKWERYLRKQWNAFYSNRPFEQIEVFFPFTEVKGLIEANQS